LGAVGCHAQESDQTSRDNRFRYAISDDVSKAYIDEAANKLTARLKMTGRAVICPYAEVAMDVDKPNQLEMMRADLMERRSN
jgi:hypothetical protein